MTNLDKIEFIDEFLSELEDVLHGTEGINCTKSRKHLEELKQAINYSQCCVSHENKETQNLEVGDIERAIAFNFEASQLKTCEVDEQLLKSMNKLNDSDKYKKPTKKRF